MADSNYQDGAYRSFAEFLANNPTIINYEPVIIEKNKIKISTERKNNQKDTIEIWGLCKGGEIYKYYEETLIPIERKNNDFVLSGYIDYKHRHNLALPALGLGVGVSLVTVAINIISLTKQAAAKLPLVKSISYIDDPKKQPIAICIDMKTGEFSF